MTSAEGNRKDIEGLRDRAEKLLSRSPRDIVAEDYKDVRALIHELSVYQVELEMQNQNLLNAQLELQASRDMYLDLYNTIPVSCLSVDAKASVLEANDTSSELFGIRKRDLVNSSITHFIAPESQDTFYMITKGILKTGGKQSYELEMKKADGTTFPAYLESIAIKDTDGLIRSQRIAISDISKLKQAEETLRASEERYRLLADNVKDAIWLMDLELNLLWFSPSCEKLRGYTVEEMKTMPLDKHVTPESFQRAMGLFLKAMDDEKQGNLDPGRFYGGEFEFFCKDGSTFWADCKMSFMRNEKGEATGMLFEGFDITERKQAEEETQKSYARLAEAQHVAHVGSWDWNVKTNVLQWSDEMHRIFGIEQRQFGATYEAFLNCVHPDDREFVEKSVHNALYENKPYNLDYRIILPNGSNRDIYAQGKVTFDNSREPIMMMGTVQDITERKKMEEELKGSRDFLERLTNSMWDIVFSVKWPEGIIEWANDSLKLMGYRPEECIGKTTEFLYSNREDFLTFGKKLENAIAAGKDVIHTEQSLRRKNGEAFPVEITVTFFKENGQLVRVTSIVHNITERKQADEALRKSEEKFRSIVENSTDQIFMLDRDCKFLSINKAAAEISKKSPQEMIGMSIFAVFSEETAARFSKNIKNVFDTGEGIYIEEKMVAQGREFVNSTSLNPIKDAKGDVTAVIGIVRDITEHKKLEEERQKIERLESIGTLAGGIAHDFNNLLTGIIGNISLAKRHVEPKGEVSERLEEAEKASMRARDLTQQLLIFSRGGAPVKKLISISELIEESANFVLRGSKVKPEFSFAEDLWDVEADEGQINQVIHNVVKNADEAMPESGVVKISARNITVKDKSTLPLDKGRNVEISIEDSGIGIKKENLARMFEPYFTTKQKGSGLGLATAYSIIKNHGGYIDADSTVGVGTVFHIYLPASKKQVSKKKEEEVQPTLIGQGRILVMDDEAVIRLLLSKVLEGAGYAVETTKDGAETIERYTKAKESGEPFDAVIMDLTIPGGMGGKEAIKKLLEIDPEAKAIVSSGYATDPIMSDYKKYGFSGVVAKPYSAAEIEKTLHSLLGKKK